MATHPNDKSKQIAEAAELYSENAWRNMWPVVSFTAALGAWLGACTGLAVAAFRLTREGTLAHSKGMLVVGATGLVAVGGAAAIIVAFLRWHARWRAAHAELTLAGRKRQHSWVRVVSAVAVLPLWFILFGPLYKGASVVLQPLLWAGFLSTIVAVDIGASVLAGAAAPWRRCPVGLAAMGAYDLYAIAIALGAPQPWVNVPGAVGMDLRIGVPLCLVSLAVIGLGQVHSRRQFQRLQRLVNEGPSDATHGSH